MIITALALLDITSSDSPRALGAARRPGPSGIRSKRR